jgi:hypothetical protein
MTNVCVTTGCIKFCNGSSTVKPFLLQYMAATSHNYKRNCTAKFNGPLLIVCFMGRRNLQFVTFMGAIHPLLKLESGLDMVRMHSQLL